MHRWIYKPNDLHQVNLQLHSVVGNIFNLFNKSALETLIASHQEQGRLFQPALRLWNVERDFGAAHQNVVNSCNAVYIRMHSSECCLSSERKLWMITLPNMWNCASMFAAKNNIDFQMMSTWPSSKWWEPATAYASHQPYASVGQNLKKIVKITFIYLFIFSVCLPNHAKLQVLCKFCFTVCSTKSLLWISWLFYVTASDVGPLDGLVLQVIDEVI